MRGAITTSGSSAFEGMNDLLAESEAQAWLLNQTVEAACCNLSSDLDMIRVLEDLITMPCRGVTHVPTCGSRAKAS
jgi:hypothetical protein